MCNYTNCKNILKIKGGSTKGLYTHLLSVHKINLTTITLATKQDEPPTKTKKMLTKYFLILKQNEKSLTATFPRFTALDGISFIIICCLIELCAVLAIGFKCLPTAVNTVQHACRLQL